MAFPCRISQKSSSHEKLACELQQWASSACSPAQTPCVKGDLGRRKIRHQIDRHKTALWLLELTILLGEYKTHANPSLLTTCPCVYGRWLILSWSITPRSCVEGVRTCFLKAVKGKLSFSKWSWIPICVAEFYTCTHTRGFLGLGWVPFGLAWGLSHSFTQTVTTKDIGFSSQLLAAPQLSAVWFQFIFSPLDTLSRLILTLRWVRVEGRTINLLPERVLWEPLLRTWVMVTHAVISTRKFKAIADKAPLISACLFLGGRWGILFKRRETETQGQSYFLKVVESLWQE